MITLMAMSLLTATAAPAGSNQLQADTVQAWDEYVRNAELRMKVRLDGGAPYLWTDESASRRQRIARGEVIVEPLLADGNRRVPHGLIHHWIGGIFIPGVTIDSLSTVMTNYDAHKDFYKPVVADSKLLSCSATDQAFWMLWQHKILFITTAMEGQYQGRHIRVDSRRGYNVADSIRMQEIENYGRPGQRLLAPGTGEGYIWRLHSFARYEERNGGVNLEVEGIALSRDIPVSVRWLVNPIVNRLSMSSLTTTLQQTRDAVHSMPAVAADVCG